MGTEQPASASLARWILACAIAEGIGMTAAASAAQVTTALFARATAGAVVATLAVMVVGGLIEGGALGALQARQLARWVPRFSRTRWTLSTTIVAGIGWALASAPAAIAPDGGDAPALAVALAGALGLGAAMGAALGLAQAGGFGGRVIHPWRWVAISALAWPPAMVVIFAGATLPDASWPALAVIPLGTATGLLAGAVLGLVSGLLLPWLRGASVVNAAVLALLESPAHGLLDRALGALRVTGRLTGRQLTFPVQYAREGASIIVLPARPDTKRWWHNLEEPAVVEMLVRGHWLQGRARVVHTGDPGYSRALQAYEQRWPRVNVGSAPLVIVAMPHDDLDY
jgi:hypothetical protein